MSVQVKECRAEHADADQPRVTCSECGAEKQVRPTARDNPRLPAGWKRLGDETLCPTCKARRFRLCAVTFPVADVVGAEWAEFTAALRLSWSRTTELANWAVRHLLLADGDRQATDERLAPMPRVNLYRTWTDTYHDRAAWAGAAQAANAVLHAAEKKYRACRYNVVWLNQDRPPRYTYPVPYPVHNAAWSARYEEVVGKDGQRMRVPVVVVTLAGRKWTIRLRGGPERRRQLAAFAQMASGEAVRGELALYRQRSYGSHRRTASEREPGGGSTVKTRIMVKLVAYLPRPKVERQAEGTLAVRTGRKALLVATCPGQERPWLYHANHLRRLIHEYDRHRQAIADDLKAEMRPMSPALREHSQAAATKINRRLDTETRRMASMVVRYAVRQRLACLAYDPSDQRYFERFDYARLRRYIAEACDREGLEFVLASASGEAVEDNPDGEMEPNT